MTTEPVLRLQNIHKSFGSTQVLRGVDVTVDAHEVVALIGASGSGKSTLLRTINLLERVDDGQVWLQGVDISDPRTVVDQVRARIGVVFQHYNLFPHLTVLDNVTLASRRVFKQSRDAAEAHGLELLERIGLAPQARSYPDRLSGGQQQRAAIARAVADQPRVAAAGRDHERPRPRAWPQVSDLVRELKTEGTTIVMATHEMAFARDVADRVVFLDSGVVAEQGAPAEVFGAPREERTQAFLSRFNAG